MSLFVAKSRGYKNNDCPIPEANGDDRVAGTHGKDHGARREIMLLAASGLLFALTLLFEAKIAAAVGRWAVYPAYAIPYLLCGVGIFREALTEMRKANFFNEFTLMCIATVAAIALGELAEAVGVMLFYRLGEFFQERAASGSRKSIAALLAEKPNLARLVADRQVCEVRVEEVAIGSIFEVRAGENIPLDGQVVSGQSQADQSPLTGESLPVVLLPGSSVLAGSINLSGTLRVQATSLYADSHMARILDMVENASQRKSPTERFISRFAGWYTPTVVALAALVAL
ncbi:MAG TPA: heavy metal translocating P-type ATPase, partial [Desulfobulbaceae bacterium]|nr:heavy metal translocating P-type ATPase [Desulfobulbaceae bacterium]